MCFSISRDSDEEDMETSEDELEEVAMFLSNGMDKMNSPVDRDEMHVVTSPDVDQGGSDICDEPQLVSSADLDGCEGSFARLEDVDFDDLAG